jgi:ATP-dependent 26S proteasome regulatory subunit
MPCSEDIHLEDVVACTAGFSGAECVSVAREAALAALSESMDAAFVSQRHLLAAARRVVRDGCLCTHSLSETGVVVVYCCWELK